MNKGKLISLEGLDGSGKTTQAHLLVDALNSMGYETIYLREPGGLAVCEQIREILLGNTNEENDLCDDTELLLFMASRMQLVNKIIKPTLAKGFHVVLDRYIGSTLAYQGYASDNIDAVSATIYLFLKDMIPDKTFYLSVPLEFLEKTLMNKVKDRIESRGIEYYTKVKEGFDVYSSLHWSSIKEIEVTTNNKFKDHDLIHREILAEVLDLIRN